MTAETSNARGEWVLVPREPSESMLSALMHAVNASCNRAEWYAHMLAAAPQPAEDAEVWLFKGTDGEWRTFHNEQHRLDTIADGRWDVRKFYALAPPPAVARVDVRELVAKLAAHVRPTCSELWDEAQAFLAAEGVQAGEVSAYDLAVLDDAAETLDRLGDGSTGLRAARARIASALSQPAGDAEAKTLPVPTRVHLIGETAVIVGTPGRGWDEEGPEAHNCDAMGCATIGPHVLARVPFTDERALPQAAEAQGVVDVAAAKRAVAAVMSAPDGISVEAFFRIVLEAALATKHQEPTTCKHDFRRDEDHGGACCQLCGEVRQ